MAATIEKAVKKIVSEALEKHVAQVRDEIVRSVMDEIRPKLEAKENAPVAASSSPTDLLAAIAGIQLGASQRDILRTLLDSMAKYSGRSALFVVKSGAATGWQGRGFANNDAVKDLQLDTKDGLAAHALQSRTSNSGSSSEMGDAFTSQLGKPTDDRVIVLPLLLKDKIAALVYADAGDGTLDPAALEVLVLSTGAWLEVVSLRKTSQKDGVEGSAPERTESAPVPQTVSSYSDPFASHAPKHVAPPAAPVSEPVAVAETSAAATAAAPATDPFAGLSPEDADLHRKAQRFARLLVDEIKLYNQVKVSEGRKHKDIYDRLKEDIEKSRGTYQKRYGNTAAASVDYFTQEVIRSLAEDDVSFMGANFKR